MRTAGFKQTIPAVSGVEYHLPTAEYFANTTDLLQVVYNEAELAAKTVGKKYWIIVSQVTNICSI